MRCTSITHGASQVRKTTDEHRASLGLTLNVGKLSVLPNLNYTFRHENLAYKRGELDIDKLRDVDLWQPDLTLRWKVRRGQSLEAAYHYSTSVPNLLETVAYTDNTNPLFVIQGNPMLKNSHTHSASINYFLNMTQQQRSISAGVNYERWMSQQSQQFLLCLFPHLVLPLPRVYPQPYPCPSGSGWYTHL